ncbi:unnamed protein product [Alternaria alternata]
MAPTNPQLTLSLGLGGPLSPDSDSDDDSLLPPRSSGRIMDDTTRPATMLLSTSVLQDSEQSAAWLLTEPLNKNAVRSTDQEPNVVYQTAEPPLPTRATSTPPRVRRQRKARLGLPITLHKQGILATVLACADTGADVNIISHDVARTLGYSEYEVLPEKKEFALANGKLIEAIGRIESPCSFGVETNSLIGKTLHAEKMISSAGAWNELSLFRKFNLKQRVIENEVCMA